MAFGNAERQTLVTSTMPMSSASSICSSFAADSSSFAMANETANDRSDPMDDSASLAADDGDGDSEEEDEEEEEEEEEEEDMVEHSEVSVHNLQPHELAQASTEGFFVRRNGQIGPLRVRRFLFSSKGKYQQLPRFKRCREGMRKRVRPSSSGKRSYRPARTYDGSSEPVVDPRHTICFATTFGATLRTLLEFAGVDPARGDQVTAAMDDIADFFSSVKSNVEQVTGGDREHLINGLATQRVSKRQCATLPECVIDQRLRRSWLYKSGQSNVAFGATAAILVAHYVLAVTGSQPEEVIQNLTRSINVTRELLREWSTSSFNNVKMYTQALGAEIRALERARAAATAASEVAATQKLDRLSALHLQLSYMKAAAWPAKAVCQAGASHDANLEKLRAGASIEQQKPPTFLPPSAQSLCLLNRDLSELDDDASEFGSGDSVSADSVYSASSAVSASSACSGASAASAASAAVSCLASHREPRREPCDPTRLCASSAQSSRDPPQQQNQSRRPVGRSPQIQRFEFTLTQER